MEHAVGASPVLKTVPMYPMYMCSCVVILLLVSIALLSNQKHRPADNIAKPGEFRQNADQHHKSQADKHANGRYIVIANAPSPFVRQD